MRTIVRITKRFARSEAAFPAVRFCCNSRNLILLCGWLSFTFPAFAQSPDTSGSTYRSNLLPSITIRDSRLERSGYRIWTADSLPINSALSLSNRLLWENILDARANAPGTLTTISIRGAGASRTPVFWNGLNLQSPMNGVMDVSLIPVWPDDRLELRYGGQSAAQSSGAMGGSLLLMQGQQKMKAGFSGFVNGAAGSFGQVNTSAGIGLGTKKFHSSLRAAWQQADNDFTFQKQGLDGRFYEVRQVNNFVKKLDIQQFNQWEPNEKNTLKTAFWMQDAFRELPPAITESPRETWQVDRSQRWLNTWEHAGSAKRIWTTKAAWINDFLCFNLAGDTDTSRSRQALISSEMATSFGKPWAFRAGASALRQWAQVDGYSDSTKWFGQTRLAGFAMSEWQHRETRISALLRQEWAEAQAAPFTASLSGQQGLRRVGDLRFHLSRNFNLPTLNDRFWKNLGKTDLRPEKGFSADLGWSYTRPAYSIELTGFQLVLDDWILWQPDSSGLFRPGNLRKVWSRGLEANGKWQVVRDDWKLNFSGRIQASKTTNVSVYAGSKAALGKQLAYTPNVSGGATIRVSRGIFSLAFLQQFTGARLDNGANKLKPFQLSNLLGTCNFLKGHLITEFRIENLWNAQYEVIRYRPMPGRTWNLGIGYKW